MEKIHDHVFPILEALINEAISDLKEDDIEITCQNGCNDCCYLLVEVSMEEAQQLAEWVIEQPEPTKQKFIQRIRDNAEEAKAIFANSKHNQAHVAAVDIDAEIHEDCFNEYFYEKQRLCPFNEDRSCQVYPIRPSSCRLHMVSSDPALCRYDVEDDEAYEIPDRIEELRDEFAPINTAVSKDGRWGHLAILVELALAELGEANCQ